MQRLDIAALNDIQKSQAKIDYLFHDLYGKQLEHIDGEPKTLITLAKETRSLRKQSSQVETHNDTKLKNT